MKILSFIQLCMNPGAHLFVFEHNPFKPATRVVFNMWDKGTDENANFIYPHYLKKRMEQCGYRVLLRNFTVFFPKALSLLTPFEVFMAGIPLGAQYYVMAEKPGGKL